MTRCWALWAHLPWRHPRSTLRCAPSPHFLSPLLLVVVVVVLLLPLLLLLLLMPLLPLLPLLLLQWPPMRPLKCLGRCPGARQ